MLRSHTAGELNKSWEGTEASLCGWVDRTRDIGQLFFLTIRDRYGVTQCVYETQNTDDKVMESLKKLNLEDCICVQGLVRMRSEKDQNPELPTGEIELLVSNIEVLNPCRSLPFQVKDETKVADELRLKHRYLDLRRPKMQKNLQIRHNTIQAARTALVEMGFLEIETPLLVRSTPEGARDFVVPSRLHPGKFYALPQSPQLYKQMLMISGADRYFQFAPAFRDEDLRADRVPVHTQIDMEMTFVRQEDVFKAVETFMTRIFKDVKNIELPSSFQQMPYHEAMERYGIDKPDIRFDLELKTITDLAHQTDFGVFTNAEVVRCLVVPDGSAISRKLIDGELLNKAKTYGAKGLAWTRIKDGKASGGVAKFLEKIGDDLLTKINAQEGALVLFAADTWQTTCAALAAVRLELGKMLNLIDHSRFAFLWVTDFPLFEWDADRKSWNAMHHLFTMPKDEDLNLLDTDPGKVHGQLYDLVLNGVELLSGSIRINRPEIQQKVLDIVAMPEEEARSKFGFLLESFAYGAPPHGGSAIGLDRLVALLAGEDSIREVIAYPCNNTGVFPLDGSPASLDQHQMNELHLKHVGLDKKES
tara:strand:+ start:151 stop:1917 length:1767 start_codon:yes stop_codon:yes gene_type:complete